MSDTEDNAAPLCPSCHETFGANPTKRKFIREARDFWYEFCEKRYASDSQQMDNMQKMLANINSIVSGSNSPLLPFAMFYTLRHTTTDNAIEDAFKNSNGYKALKNSLLQHVSTTRLGDYGLYNSIALEPQESLCNLSDEELSLLIEKQGYIGESAIKYAFHSTNTVFFESSDSKSDVPSLVLTNPFNGSVSRVT